MNYRKEIDGLRTVAVLSVIIYHAQFLIQGKLFFPGGFIGVDIFFVISGYLISNILLREVYDTKKISINNFYGRRIRRIIPLLLLVMISTLLFGWFFLLPQDLVALSEGQLSSIGFISNYYFYFQSIIYDAQSSLTIPMLHTWSLSVEEQFYLIFPIFLVACHKYFRERTLLLIFGAFILSLIHANSTSFSNPELGFFSFQTRAWELLLGSILALVEIKYGRNHKLFLHRTLPSVGLALIILSIVFFSKQTIHPGYLTLIPVLGTALIIYFSRKDELTGKLLGSRAMVAIGLISYSLYLWHVPIFAFGRMINEGADFYSKIYWLSLVLVLSVASYWLVERPFRNSKHIKKRTFTITITLSLVLLMSANVLILINNGYESRMPKSLQSFLRDLDRNTIIKRKHKFTKKYCDKNGLILTCNQEGSEGTPVSLIGDSHMGALRSTLVQELINDHPITIITKGGCWPILGFNRVNKQTGVIDERCDEKLQSLRFEKATEREGSIIVIAGRLPLYLSGKGFDNSEGGVERGGADLWFKYKSVDEGVSFYQGTQRTIRKLLDKGHKVIVVYPIPEVAIQLDRELLKRYRNQPLDFEDEIVKKPITTSYKVYRERTKSSFALLNSIEHDNLYRVYPHKIFCDSKIKGRCITHNKHHVFYSDSHHPGYYGSKLINKKIIQIVNEIESE